MIPSSRSRTFFFLGCLTIPADAFLMSACDGVKVPLPTLCSIDTFLPPPPTDGRRRTPSPAGPSGTRRSTRGGLFWIQRECFSPIQLRRTKTITRGAFKSPSKNREKNQTALTVFLGLLVLVFHPEFTAKLYWHSQTTLQAGFVRLFFISGVLSESRPGRRCFVLAFLGVFFCVLGGDPARLQRRRR